MLKFEFMYVSNCKIADIFVFSDDIFFKMVTVQCAAIKSSKDLFKSTKMYSKIDNIEQF